jgi:Ankyrin repeats (many copies)
MEQADEDGFKPIHLAVIQGSLETVNLLLANKIDVNALDNEGHSVVHWSTGKLLFTFIMYNNFYLPRTTKSADLCASINVLLSFPGSSHFSVRRSSNPTSFISSWC